MNVCSGLCLTTRFCRQRTCGVEELGVCKETGYEIFQYAGTSISLELTRGVDNSWCEVTVKGVPTNPRTRLFSYYCEYVIEQVLTTFLSRAIMFRINGGGG